MVVQWLSGGLSEGQAAYTSLVSYHFCLDESPSSLAAACLHSPSTSFRFSAMTRPRSTRESRRKRQSQRQPSCALIAPIISRTSGGRTTLLSPSLFSLFGEGGRDPHLRASVSLSIFVWSCSTESQLVKVANTKSN
jgi:hypothetical protein